MRIFLLKFLLTILTHYGIISPSLKTFGDDFLSDYSRIKENEVIYNEEQSKLKIVIKNNDYKKLELNDFYIKKIILDCKSFKEKNSLDLKFIQSHYKEIEELIIIGNFSTEKIIEINRFKNLKTLRIVETNVEKLFFNLPSLKKLSLVNGLLKHINEESYLDELEYLELKNNPVENLDFLEKIIEKNVLKLKILDIRGTLITEEQFLKFKMFLQENELNIKILSNFDKN